MPLISLLTKFSMKMISHFFLAFLSLILFISEMIKSCSSFLKHNCAIFLYSYMVDIIENSIVLTLASKRLYQVSLLQTSRQTYLINRNRVSEYKFYFILYYYFSWSILSQKLDFFFLFSCDGFIIQFIDFLQISLTFNCIIHYLFKSNHQQQLNNKKAVENKIYSQKFINKYQPIPQPTMSLHKSCRNQNQNYQVRQRYIPTFVHHAIFDEQPLKSHLSRCTPTFHSTVLDNDGYNVKTVHCKKQKEPQRPNTALQKSVYVNNTHQRRIEDLNPHFHNPYSSRDKWFDHTKQNLLETIKNCNVHGYSKQRKIADLSSDIVFTNFQYGTKGTNIYNNQYKNPSLAECVNCPSCPGKNACDKNVCCKLVQNSPNKINGEESELNKQNIEQVPAPQLQDSLDVKATEMKNAIGVRKEEKKDFHKNCVPERSKQLGLKGKKIQSRPQSAQRPKIVSQKPVFTVIRKSRVHQN